MMRRMRLLLRPRALLPVLAALAVVFVLGRIAYQAVGERPPEQALFLLIADDASAKTPQVQLWRDAADEVGVPLKVLHASEFLRPQPWPARPVGIVLPDGLLTRASRSLTERLADYVRGGGHLMVVYDAATQTSSGGDAVDHRALLSELVGVDYALFRQLGQRQTLREPVHGDPALLRELHVPPGKYMPVAAPGPATITSYQYGALAYPAFATQGRFDGRTLLQGRSGNLVAGLRTVGKGQVLFVNLPLGYLKLRTDGMLLHGFLAWFGERICGLPRLLSVPDGIGGLVMNIHVDSNSSLAPLQELRTHSRLFAQGPYSVHFTAGPDTYHSGDNTGLDLEHNPVSQDWVRFFAARGDAIGSHGGWIHNEFAERISETNGATYAAWIARNDAALERLTGKPVREYSSPVGHHPQWITDWLQQHGVLGYYFTGDTGMAPTRTYRYGRRSDQSTWAFPVVPYGAVASFEEASDAHIGGDEMRRWLVDLAGFAAVDRSVRLFYFHPPGVVDYTGALDRMLDAVHARGNAFRWYTITDQATFLDRREQTRWHLVVQRGGWRLEASNPQGLSGLAWHVPAHAYAGVRPVAGDVVIAPVEDGWLLRVRSGNQAIVFLPALQSTRR
jgi:hypothetical protein